MSVPVVLIGGKFDGDRSDEVHLANGAPLPEHLHVEWCPWGLGRCVFCRDGEHTVWWVIPVASAEVYAFAGAREDGTHVYLHAGVDLPADPSSVDERRPLVTA